MTPDQWRARGRYFQIDGRRMFFVEGGEGPVLLLLHAYPCASWGWHRLWPELTERFRVIAPDLPGSGFSDKPAGRHYSIFALADAVEALLADRGVRQMHVIAHAYGVTTAQELLARHDERTRAAHNATTATAHPALSSMCFVNGGLFPEATRPTLTQKLLISPIGRGLVRLAANPYRSFCKKLPRNFGPRTQPTAAELEHHWQVLAYNDGHRVVPDVLQYLKQRFEHRERWVGVLRRTAVPLQLINGAADPVSGTLVPRIWSQLLPHAPLVELDGAIGHYPPLEAPRAVLEACLAFIDGHREAAAAPNAAADVRDAASAGDPEG